MRVVNYLDEKKGIKMCHMENKYIKTIGGYYGKK